MPALSLAIPAVAVLPHFLGIVPPPLGVIRPTLVLSEFWNLWGDSTTFGVGAPSSYPAQLRTLGSGVTAPWHGQAATIGGAIGGGGDSGAARPMVGNGGTAGETTVQIAARVTALAADAIWSAEMNRPQIFSGGLNNYNNVSTGYTTTLGYGRDWPARVKADLAIQASKIGGGRDWFHLLAPMEAQAQAAQAGGNNQRANHVFHARDLIATHGRRAIDLARALRDEGQAGGMDEIDRTMNGTIPLSLRGHSDSSAVPAYSDATPIAGAGAPSDLNFAEGQPYWDTTGLVVHRKLGASGAGSWKAVDQKHFSTAGYGAIARLVADAMMASQGNGPPFAAPQEYLTSSDLADGATLGTLAFTGVATSAAITTDKGGITPSLRWQISPSGVITRKAGAPALSEGMHSVYAWLSNAYGTLRSVVDIYVDKPAAAAPRRFATQSALVSGRTFSTGVALYGRTAHGFPNGTQISGAMLVNITTLADAPYLVNLGAYGTGGGSSSFFLRVGATGLPSFGGFNAAGTAIFASNASVGTAALSAGVWTWLLFAIDTATGSAQFYLGDVAKSWTPTFNAGAINLADTSPLFYASRAPSQYDDGLGVLKGGFGPMLLFPGTIDWSVAANRRALFDTSGLPVARTPFAAVGGVIPKFDTSAGLGGLLYGPSHPGDAASLVVPGWRARSLLAVV